MGASVTTAFGSGGPTFAIGASIILLMGIGAQLWGLSSTGKASAEYRTVVRYSLPNAVSMIVLITGGFLDEGPRRALWLLFILIVLDGIVAARAGDWIVRPGHFAERHGLIVIIALGEIVVAIGIAVVEALSETDGLPNETFAGLAEAGILAGLLWWSYFDRLNPALEHRGEDLNGRQRAHFIADVYTGLHVFIVAGIIAIAAAAEEILLHPRHPVPTEFLVMFVGGFALFSLGVALAAGRAYKIIAKERIATVLVVGALAWIGRSWDGVALLFAVDVALILMIVAEHVRIEGPSAAEPVNASA